VKGAPPLGVGFMITNDSRPEVGGGLDEIRDFIAENSPAAADRVIGEILDRIDAAAPFPYQGHQRPDLTGRPLRFVTVRKYLSAYAG
jgi:plasmid stabilization system protein ParE